MRQTYLKFSFFLSAIIALASCENDRYVVDTTDISYELTFDRYENSLVALEEESLTTDIEDLAAEHPEMTELYIEQILRLGQVNNPRLKQLGQFLKDTNTVRLIEDVKKEYPDMKSYETAFTAAFKRVKYYFPSDTLPEKAYTCVSGLQIPGFTYENILGISLDWYLGEGYTFYHNQVFPSYIQRRMTKSYIVSQMMAAYYRNKFPEERHTDQTLLSKMIYWGKQIEFVKMTMPELPDSILLEYTGKQMQWSKANEGEMYQHLVDKKLWYETDANLYDRYLTDGPYTIAADVPISSAPRIGWYIGWRIVQSFRDNNGEDPRISLFENEDYKAIFREAKYKP